MTQEKKSIKNRLLMVSIFITLILLIIIFWVFNIKLTRYKYKTESLSNPTSNLTESNSGQKLNNISRSDVIKLVESNLNNKSIKDLFDSSKQQGITGDSITVVISTGDYIPARSVNSVSHSKNDFTWSVSKFSKLLSSGDITLVNLETPLLEECPITNEGMVFCGSSRHIEGLKLAGVDLASLSNNHSANYGKSGIDSTVSLLNAEGISSFGLNASPASLVVKNGIRFGFIGFNDVGNQSFINPSQTENIEEQINAASKEADVIIVTFHWGEEYTDKVTQRQISLAHAAIDSGADLVIGNHPHWIQPAEYYKNKLILYAQGNFVFDQMWSQKTREGIVAVMRFKGDELAGVEFVPSYIVDYGQATFPTEDLANQILQNFKNISISHENKLRKK